MRFIFLFVLLITGAVHGQTKYFDLAKLDSLDFKQFIADKKVIVIGEMHGTTEIPLFVLSLIRKLSKNKGRITIGLEIPTNHQREVEEFLKTDDFDKLLKLDYFKYPDGRTSIAMGELIKGLRDIKGLRVICFDIDTNLDAKVNRDSTMGVNLSRGYKGGQLIMLTGNLHANLKEGYWRPNFKSAVYHFNKIGKFENSLISLNTYFGSGTIWNCMQDGCKERNVNSNSVLKQKSGPTNFIGIYEGIHPSGYSGFIYLDNVKASEPLLK
jgi:hypothetical protein